MSPGVESMRSTLIHVCLLCCLFVTVLGANRSAAQMIGVYADLDATSCDITAPVYTSTDFYLFARGSANLQPAGVNGAEFRVQHDVNSEAILTSTANPASNVALGDPMGGGCNIAFPQCQSGGPEDLVLLYTVNFFAFMPVEDRLLQIDAHSTPSNPNFPCALINKCDAPIFTAVCVATSFGCVNYAQPNPCQGLAVEERGWSGVKELFR